MNPDWPPSTPPPSDWSGMMSTWLRSEIGCSYLNLHQYFSNQKIVFIPYKFYLSAGWEFLVMCSLSSGGTLLKRIICLTTPPLFMNGLLNIVIPQAKGFDLASKLIEFWLMDCNRTMDKGAQNGAYKTPRINCKCSFWVPKDTPRNPLSWLERIQKAVGCCSVTRSVKWQHHYSSPQQLPLIKQRLPLISLCLTHLCLPRGHFTPTPDL